MDLSLRRRRRCREVLTGRAHAADTAGRRVPARGGTLRWAANPLFGVPIPRRALATPRSRSHDECAGMAVPGRSGVQKVAPDVRPRTLSRGDRREVPVIRVLVADDHEFVRAGLIELLDATGDMTVVAECQDGDEVVTAALQTPPDVVLLDLRMRRLPGLEAARALRAVRPDARIVVLTGSPSQSSAGEARELGAVGYLLKGSPPEKLGEQLRTVAQGGTAWDRSVLPSEMA